MTKTEKLLRKLGRQPMTHAEIVRFLTDGKVTRKNRTHYDSMLYGNNITEGVLERFCYNVKGTWHLYRNAKLTSPFLPRRATTAFVGSTTSIRPAPRG